VFAKVCEAAPHPLALNRVAVERPIWNSRHEAFDLTGKADSDGKVVAVTALGGSTSTPAVR
jgi:hypothetical protein